MFGLLTFCFLCFRATTALQGNCENINCSHIFDPVCGIVHDGDGSGNLNTFHNICYFTKISCSLRNQVVRVPNSMCEELKHPKRRRSLSLRRAADFSVVGAHEVCNHTCPTYCIDTYEPACAQIWNKNMTGFETRTMVNHCHVDLFSCAVGVNVTIKPLGACYKNPTALTFMTHMAAFKSLRLLN